MLEPVDAPAPWVTLIHPYHSLPHAPHASINTKVRAGADAATKVNQTLPRLKRFCAWRQRHAPPRRGRKRGRTNAIRGMDPGSDNTHRGLRGPGHLRGWRVDRRGA